MNPVVWKVADEELGGCDQIHIIEPINGFDSQNFEARYHLCVLQILVGFRKKYLFMVDRFINAEGKKV